MLNLHNRDDLLNIFNNARFSISHYVHGFWPMRDNQWNAMPVNRLFFPLKNPNGENNHISDASHTHFLEPGRMYFIPAFLPARFSLDEQLYFLSVHTNLDIFPSVELFSGCPHMLNIPCPEETGKLLQFFDKGSETSFFDAIKVGSLALSITAKVLGHYRMEDFSSPLSLKKFSRLPDYLIRNGNAKTSVTDLAELYGLSRENFTRKFTMITGFTPKKLIDRFVIKRCISLLDEGYSVKETGNLMNFSNEFVFSRYFKRVTGVPPNNWKNTRSRMS